jgi:methyl-accepting chemotaxis protein
MDIKLSRASSVNYANTQLFRTLLIVSIAVIAVAIGIALFLAFYISGLISKPLTVLTTFMQKAGTTGDIFMSDADRAVFVKNAQIRDEIGQTIGATSAFISHVTEVSGSLQTIAGGDLTVEVKLLSDSDTMGLSLKSMVSNLNNMFSEINSATSQVSAGSNCGGSNRTSLICGAACGVTE